MRPRSTAVYKLQEYAGRPRRKRSTGKATWPGRKQVYRRSGPDGQFAGDTVTAETDPQSGEPLLEHVMAGGKRLRPLPTLAQARDRARARSSLACPARLPASTPRRRRIRSRSRRPCMRSPPRSMRRPRMSAEMPSDALTPLAAEVLVRRCDPAAFPFETTAALDAPFGVVGQERAARALAFGVGVAHEGYNVFVMGPAGLRQAHAAWRTRSASGRAAPRRPRTGCYVNNFAAPHRPTAIELPAGRGAGFKRDMERLVEELRATIPAVFESEEYAHRGRGDRRRVRRAAREDARGPRPGRRARRYRAAAHACRVHLRAAEGAAR